MLKEKGADATNKIFQGKGRKFGGHGDPDLELQEKENRVLRFLSEFFMR